jgi:hypothetical protein
MEYFRGCIKGTPLAFPSVPPIYLFIKLKMINSHTQES